VDVTALAIGLTVALAIGIVVLLIVIVVYNKSRRRLDYLRQQMTTKKRGRRRKTKSTTRTTRVHVSDNNAIELQERPPANAHESGLDSVQISDVTTTHCITCIILIIISSTRSIVDLSAYDKC